MDTEPYYQSWTKKNGNLPQSLPAKYKTESEKSDEEKLLKDLSKIFAAGRRRIILIATVALVVTGAIAYKLKDQPKSYEGRFVLLVEPVTTSENKLVSLLSQTVGEQNRLTIEDFTLDYETQIRVLRSPKLMVPIIEKIQEKYRGVDYDTLMEQLTIERPMKEKSGTRLLSVSYKDKNPEKVQFVLDKLAEAYLKYSLKDRQTKLRQGIEFIQAQLPEREQRVNMLQEQLQKLRQQSNLIEPGKVSQTLTEHALALEKKRVDIQAELAQSRVNYTTHKKLFDEGNIEALLSEDEAAYTRLLLQIHDLNTEIAEKSARWGEKHPSLIALREKQQDLVKLSRKEAETILEKAAGKIQELEASNQIIMQAENNIRKQMKEFPAVARRYAELNSELEVATDALNKLLTKLDALRIDSAQQELPWELITPPEIPRDKDGNPQAAPVNKKNYILGAVLGLVLGIGSAVVVEIFNNVFHSPEDVEEETKLPVLGIVPFAKEAKSFSKNSGKLARIPIIANLSKQAGKYLVISKNAKPQGYISSPLLEAFRSLYTNIRLLSPDKPIQSLIIGSATPGDGKSTVAVYLAQTAAAIGQRVLLVDADLRRPKIHKKLGLPNVRGLSEVISSDIGLNEVIQRSPSQENLFVLTAGSIPPDPIKELSSEKMRHLMEQFQAFFDLVIYDTPPVVGLADANLLAAYTDGLVMVIGLEKTDRFMAIKALDGLNIAGAAVLGVVANGVKGYKTKVYKAYQRI
ncbi:polysaccharide biosynthesis tyrosine autokinase [Planktothrix sp. FACHB-1355]|uniref:non-specific protein-tyrosine kinase n=1 Tax=Aerosakkonema funiforme FACHB-1375 TaxID=2949571 RepID=A0A926ZFS5_9CYAN|nr:MULTISPECIES: tyrosine-protein kinase family protein [Oscillatoriales]MBD2180984.1 polysaccharide biosynthesis tyrosine autokinase [Aerosakkonema funiforme FACHB-1375]MBD3558525.1 polysaccharide biosynthesis tyrosine autokinase [Planktothrix sp. FACHB-1355]